MIDRRRPLTTFSGSRLAAWYFAAQALAIAGWWLYLGLVPDARRLFLPPGAADADLMAFQAPDLLVAAPVSFMAAAAIRAHARWAVPLAWFAAGAIVYAFVYCVAWSLLRGGAWLNVALMAPAALLSVVGALDISAGTIRIFRRAAPSRPARHVAATLIQIALFWSFFLVAVPAAIRFVERQLEWPLFAFPLQRATAAILLLACSALGLVSGFTMSRKGVGTPLPFAGTNRLVTTGPYAYVRNPMVIAGLGQGLAVALWLGSWAVLAYVAVGGVIWQLLVRPAEERDLQEVFGDEFTAYCRRVRCWLPRHDGHEGSATEATS